MTKPKSALEVADEVPWSDGITEYDDQHEETYIRLLDADEERVSKGEMARLILSINPDKPERARKAAESHLARARWMTEVGYRHLAAGRYSGTESDQADTLQWLLLLTRPPTDGTGTHRPIPAPAGQSLPRTRKPKNGG